MLQTDSVLRLIFGLLLLPGVLHASPRLTFSPEETQSQPSVPCSSGASQSFRIGTLANLGDSTLAVSAILIHGLHARDFAFDSLAEPTPEGLPSMLSETLYLEAANQASDTQALSIPVSVLCALDREASGLLQAELVIISNDPSTPKLSIPFTAPAAALPNLALGQLEGKLSTSSHKRSGSRRRAKTLTLEIPIANLAHTPTQLPVEVVVSLEIKDPLTHQVVKRLRKRVTTTDIVGAPDFRILSVSFDNIPARAVKFEQSLRMHAIGSGRVAIDPRRRILEGNETPEGKTAQREYEDNTTSFSILTKADIRHGF